MKNIIVLTVTSFLGLSLVGCKNDSKAAPKGTLNVLNQTEYGLEVQLGGKAVVELKNGECASFTQDQLSQLSLKKITPPIWEVDFELDRVFCNNNSQNKNAGTGISQCKLTAASVYAENAEGDEVLMEYQAPAKDSEEEAADFSKCKPVGAEEEEEEES